MPRSAAIPTPAAAPWPHAPAAARQARRTGLAVLATLGVLVAAVWAVPPMLDWNRFRTEIAAFAGAELGRTVVIGGDVTLRLLPQAVLTANDVTVPDQGDGMSARVASLRLEVGIWPLLAGRLVVHDLVLGSPVLTLPAALPGSVVNPARPHVPHAFAAHVENGILRTGMTDITGITAAIHGGPVATDAPEAGAVAAFGAEGFANFDGQRWRFTTALGAPDADGVSAVDLAVQGEGPARDTGGAIQGTLANGVLQGRLNAAGPDLSLLMPASAQAWRAEAPFTASGERIGSTALALSLGGAPATASFSLQLAAPTRLDAHLAAASLDLDGWSRLLSGKFAAFAVPPIPMRLDLSAGGGSLLGGTLGALSGTLVFDGAHASVENVKAGLPGGASLAFSGRIERGPRAVLTLAGPASLQAPDLHATLAWLRPLAPPLLASLPDNELRRANLTGTVRLSTGRLAVAQMAGRLDDAPFSGGFDLTFGADPKLSAEARFERLDIDDWLSGAHWRPGVALEEAAHPFTRVETSLHLGAASARWHDQTLTGLELIATTGKAGLAIDRASATLPTFAVAVAGTLAADGRVSGARVHASIKDVTAFMAGLPDAWRRPSGALHGPAELTATADGPPGALDVQVRANAGDLVVEADQRRDTVAGLAETTLTVRHPGAPFLLADLGFPGADAWLGMGSLAFLAHLHSAPGFASIGDFSLDAAEVHMHGHGDLAYAGAAPSISLDLQADQLALPGLAQIAKASLTTLGLPVGWRAQIHLDAARVGVGLRPVAQDVSADLTVAQRAVVLDMPRARVAGGILSAELAADAGQVPAIAAVRGRLSKAVLAAPLTGWPLDLVAGVADLDFDLGAAGSDLPAILATLEGQAKLSVRSATLTGLSLPLLDSLLAGHAPSSRDAIQGALSQGETDGLSATADLQIDHGRASLGDASLVSTEGSILLNGTADLSSQKVDLSIGVTPAVPGSLPFSIRLSGAGAGATSTVDLASFPAPHKPVKRPARRPKRAG